LTAEFPDGTDIPVFADADRLRQILVNLVMNALKFTPRGGRITVSLRREGPHAHFCVEDTGKGLSPEDSKRVFDRFFQVDRPERQQGLGLGLHIVQGLVSLHEGRIWVESEPGSGARFHFVLPGSPQTKVLQPQPPSQTLRTNPN
jgi:signal transduction histidine kinase